MYCMLHNYRDNTHVQYNMCNVHMDNSIHAHCNALCMYMYMLPIGSAKVACVL